MDLKKTKKVLSSLLILILIFFVLGAWMYSPLYVLAIALTVLYVIVYLKWWRCPQCGKILGRGANICCHYCGKETGITMRF